MGKTVVTNRKARHEYHIEETYEVGIVLQGTEVKSIRAGRVNLKDSFARIENNEVFLYNLHISPYEQGNRYNHDPERVRKLLLHKNEIRKLIGKTQQEGYTLIPLKIYFTRQLVKIQLALGKGKNLYDKRQDLKRKSAKREIQRAFKDSQVGRY
ncbi:SsrA-binding protein [Orenia metallireducens]|jgi:SsrA-binding protein|uniref:SsrA-binding protein n=1 Tax=Orenia metallireducens TaxID=1413210 RepID=A0A285H8X6_9FIRM|nr:SsrA-binding protein SmpB [Orenia metallireducens]PRX28652.1 SsrA-binding protein [Orenia metallireducens]SNY31071.1 SsrA-binding protein [Orenia metallireducens]